MTTDNRQQHTTTFELLELLSAAKNLTKIFYNNTKILKILPSLFLPGGEKFNIVWCCQGPVRVEGRGGPDHVPAAEPLLLPGAGGGGGVDI